MPKTQTSPPKLNDTQLVILSAAAQRGDHALLPFPQSLTVKGAALDKIIATLRKRNLIQEQQIVDGAPEWRRDEASCDTMPSMPQMQFDFDGLIQLLPELRHVAGWGSHMYSYGRSGR